MLAVLLRAQSIVHAMTPKALKAQHTRIRSNTLTISQYTYQKHWKGVDVIPANPGLFLATEAAFMTSDGVHPFSQQA